MEGSIPVEILLFCKKHLVNFRTAASFVETCEASCHIMMALYGFYLILSERVKLTSKNLVKALIFIYSAVGFGVFLNWCFHLSNFGMNMYGNYSIYFIDIFGSFAATFVAYLVGIFIVVVVGYFVGFFLSWVSTPAVKKSETAALQPEEGENQESNT